MPTNLIDLINRQTPVAPPAPRKIISFAPGASEEYKQAVYDNVARTGQLGLPPGWRSGPYGPVRESQASLPFNSMGVAPDSRDFGQSVNPGTSRSIAPAVVLPQPQPQPQPDPASTTLLSTWQQYATNAGWTQPQQNSAAPQPMTTQPQAVPEWFAQAPSWMNQVPSWLQHGPPNSQPATQSTEAVSPQPTVPAQMTLGQVQTDGSKPIASATAYPGQRYQQQSLGGFGWQKPQQRQQPANVGSGVPVSGQRPQQRSSLTLGNLGQNLIA